MIRLNPHSKSWSSFYKLMSPKINASRLTQAKSSKNKTCLFLVNHNNNSQLVTLTVVRHLSQSVGRFQQLTEKGDLPEPPSLSEPSVSSAETSSETVTTSTTDTTTTTTTTSASHASTSAETVTTTSSTSAETVQTSAVESNELILDFLPDKPVPITSTSADGITENLVYVGDPPFEALGLASWYPAGRVQYFMEQMHVGFDIPWWGAIAISTLAIRLITFPMVVKAQKNAATLNNNLPQMTILQEKLSDARKRGDMYDSTKYGMELQKFMKEKDVNPMKNILPIMVQMPFFLSMFVGLRGMANLPVESMMQGGLGWFQDLTVSDPYYMLPVMTSATLYLQFKLSADGANLQTAGPILRNVMKIIPLAVLPITMNFPAALTFYWLTTNIISVVQARFVRTPAVRDKLGIPKMIKWNKDKIPAQNKSFREGVKESIANWKVQADIADRRVHDEQAFREAGLGRPKRTYKFDPTKPLK